MGKPPGLERWQSGLLSLTANQVLGANTTGARVRIPSSPPFSLSCSPKVTNVPCLQILLPCLPAHHVKVRVQVRRCRHEHPVVTLRQGDITFGYGRVALGRPFGDLPVCLLDQLQVLLSYLPLPRGNLRHGNGATDNICWSMLALGPSWHDPSPLPIQPAS